VAKQFISLRAAPAERRLEETVAYALNLARNCSPASIAEIKWQVRRHLSTSFEEAVADSDRLESFKRADLAEWVRSYRERRPPAFPALITRS
jgi:enoyl-CoA hydratase/carnithine racemase